MVAARSAIHVLAVMVGSGLAAAAQPRGCWSATRSTRSSGSRSLVRWVVAPGWPARPRTPLTALGHLRQALLQAAERGDEGAVGLAEPNGGQLGEQQVHAVADLGPEDPDHASAPVRQPIEDDRPNGIQADLQRQRRGSAPAPRAGRDQMGEATGQPGQHRCGQRRTRQYDTGPDLLAAGWGCSQTWSSSRSRLSACSLLNRVRSARGRWCCPRGPGSPLGGGPRSWRFPTART